MSVKPEVFWEQRVFAPVRFYEFTLNVNYNLRGSNYLLFLHLTSSVGQIGLSAGLDLTHGPYVWHPCLTARSQKETECVSTLKLQFWTPVTFLLKQPSCWRNCPSQNCTDGGLPTPILMAWYYWAAPLFYSWSSCFRSDERLRGAGGRMWSAARCHWGVNCLSLCATCR